MPGTTHTLTALSPSGLLEDHCWGVTRSSSPGLKELKIKGDQPPSLHLKSWQGTGLVWKHTGDLVLLKKTQIALRLKSNPHCKALGAVKLPSPLRISPAAPWLLPSGTHSLPAVKEPSLAQLSLVPAPTHSSSRPCWVILSKSDLRMLPPSKNNPGGSRWV